MTNEEAIKRLTILTDYEYDEDLEALEMGIKALKETDNHGNCDLTMFGDCSYKETGCSDCKIKEKIREALKKADAFVHVRFTHPRFGEADGWVDRHLEAKEAAQWFRSNGWRATVLTESRGGIEYYSVWTRRM